MDSIACNAKRMIVARFDAGEDLLLSLKKCAEEHGIASGTFSAIGGLKEITYGLYREREHHSIKKTARNIFELISISGNISIKEGAVLVHAHVLAADEEEGRAFGGHLMEGSKISPFVEVIIQECDAPLGRHFDPATNLWPLVPGK